MLPYRRLFKYRMGRYSGSYDISPSSIDIDRSQVSRYFDISSIEPALVLIKSELSLHDESESTPSR